MSSPNAVLFVEYLDAAHVRGRLPAILSQNSLVGTRGNQTPLGLRGTETGQNVARVVRIRVSVWISVILL